MIFIRVILILVAIAGSGILILMTGRTVGTVGWTVVAAAFLVSAITGRIMWKFWRQVTTGRTMWLNWSVHSLFFTVLLSASYFTINYFTATARPLVYERSVVTRVYSEQRHRSRRIGRRRYVQGEPYNVYKAEIESSRGSMTIDLNLTRYNSLHRGDSLDLPFSSGIFGMQVLVTDSIRYPQRKPTGRKRRASLL